MATHTHPSIPCTICGYPLEGKEAIEFVENFAKTHPSNDHPHDLSELGKKYPALKKEYDELRILCDEVLKQRLIAETARDECIEALKIAKKYIHCPVEMDGLEYMENVRKPIDNALNNKSNP